VVGEGKGKGEQRHTNSTIVHGTESKKCLKKKENMSSIHKILTATGIGLLSQTTRKPNKIFIINVW
jgi:hypothetical protein